MATRTPEGTSRFVCTFKFTGPDNPEPTEMTEFPADNDAKGAMQKVIDVYAAEGKTVDPDSFTTAINANTLVTIV